MSGLGQLVPYFECQYPQVLPMGLETFEAVVNSSGAQSQASAAQGMGDYLDPFGWPIPQYLTPGNNRGLGCADCGGSCGLGEVFDGTGFLGTGLFLSADPSTWGAGEFGALAIGVLTLYYLTKGVNKAESSYRGARRSVKGKVRKVKSGVKRRTSAAKTLFAG